MNGGVRALEEIRKYRPNELHCSVQMEAAEVGAQRERARKQDSACKAGSRTLRLRSYWYC